MRNEKALDLTTRQYGMAKFLIGFCKVTEGSNLVHVLLFTTRIVENIVVSITISKTK